jgi:polyphosphate kinase
VRSIVGRFLEHSRIYYFRNGGNEQIYLGSADLMPRNINHRVEVLFPVQDGRLIRYLRQDVLAIYLRDNVKAHIMQPDGSYIHLQPEPGEQAINTQNLLMARHQRSVKE